MEDSLKAQFQYLSHHLIEQSKFQNANKINSAAYAGSMYSLGWQKAFEAETTIGVPGISKKISYNQIGYEDLQTNVPIINEFIGKRFQLLSEPLYNKVKEHFQPLEAPGLAPHFFTDPNGFTCHLSYTLRHFENTPHKDDDTSPYSFAMWLPIDQNSGNLIEEDLDVFPKLGFGIDFTGFQGVVECAWKANSFYHLTLPSSSPPESPHNRLGLSCELPRKTEITLEKKKTKKSSMKIIRKKNIGNLEI
jgi:hypothetical protein